MLIRQFRLRRYQNTYYRVHEILTGLTPENVPEVVTQMEAVAITELPVLAHVITMVYDKVRCRCVFFSVRDSGSPIDYRCDNRRFGLSTHNCQVPTPTFQNLATRTTNLDLYCRLSLYLINCFED